MSHRPRAIASHWTVQLRSRLWLLASALVWAGPALAEDTLARIASTGRIVIGAHDSAVPLSYLGPEGGHIGFQMDICERIVTEIGQRLHLAPLRTVTVPILMATRTAMLGNGTIDMDCGPNPINTSSLRLGLLTHATLAHEFALVTTAEKRGMQIADLNGKSIGIIAGSPAASRLRALARDSKFKATETFIRDGAEAMRMLADGRVDAVASPRPFLLAMLARMPDPERYAVLDMTLGRFYDAIGFRLADENLRAIANDVIVSLARTGELAKLYDRWFVQPIPGLLRPIGAPQTAAQRELFATPGSEMLEL